MLNGQFVKGELTTAAANGNPVAIPMYDADCVVRALGAKERLVLRTLTIVNGATAQTVTVGQDVNANATYDAGESIEGGDFGANGGIAATYPDEGYMLKFAKVPSVKTSGANTVTVRFTGVIINT